MHTNTTPFFLGSAAAACRSIAMTRMSSTYHLYKIALLVKTDDAVKDSVILKPDEPSKALYFIVSGTVEVIQVRRCIAVRARPACRE